MAIDRLLGEGSDFLVPLPLMEDKSDLVQVERAPKERETRGA
jgi:hypothetical protein